MKRIYVIPILLGLLWTVLLAALFLWSIVGERRHIQDLAERQARALFQQIVAARAWNSAHGGVFLPQSDATAPNPYLPEEERVLRAASGQVLIKVNPAYMTRQIAEIAAHRDGVRLHITSLNPIRPENAPDAWERTTLSALVPGLDRFELVPAEGGEDKFRFLAPLTAEASCLHCHPKDTLGAIRGGITVSFPAAPLLAYRDANLRKQATAYGIIWLVGLLGLGGYSFDLSRKREKAEALSRTKSRFLANMSHDMRTPLTGIIGLSDRLLRQERPDQDVRFIKLIAQSAGSLLEIVNDILDFARIDSGCMELRPEPFDLRRAADRAANLFAFAAQEKGLAFTVSVDPAVPQRLNGDAFRFSQVLANLLGNAVKFTSQGYVRLHVDLARAAGDRVMVRSVVEDSGAGIAPSDLETIFGCFHQVDDSLSRRHAGSGLGLSIARQLARLMGGDVSVQSLVGHGSAFTFTADLGLATPVEAPKAETDRRPPPFAAGKDRLAGRALVVDDHHANRVLFQDLLEEWGLTVRPASSGVEALQLFARESFDLILMDLQMPGMGGVETIARLREAERVRGARPAPILVLTAFADPEEAHALPRDDIQAVVVKPIEVRLLREAVAAALPRAPGGEAVETKQGSSRPAQDAPLVVTAEALRLLGGRRDLYRMLVDEFLKSAEERQRAIEAAISRGDRQETLRLAHTVKSEAAALGASKLRERATCLEHLAGGDVSLSPDLCRDLRTTLEQTLASLREAATGI